MAFTEGGQHPQEDGWHVQEEWHLEEAFAGKGVAFACCEDNNDDNDNNDEKQVLLDNLHC